jgi:hypothetical protein
MKGAMCDALRSPIELTSRRAAADIAAAAKSFSARAVWISPMASRIFVQTFPRLGSRWRIAYDQDHLSSNEVTKRQ